MAAKYLFLFLVGMSVLSCSDTGPYLKHEASFKKVADGCTNQSPRISIDANTLGERYTFQECLDADFSKEKLAVERKGDTVVVQFRNSSAQKALFDVTLDVNTYPVYHFITIGDQTLTVVSSAK